MWRLGWGLLLTALVLGVTIAVQSKDRILEAPVEAPVAVEALEEPQKNQSRWRVDPVAARRVKSQHVLIYDVEADAVVYEKGSKKFAYPASLTKIMTQLVAIEYLDEKKAQKPTQISQDIYHRMIEEGASISGFLPGETITIEDLLYANMLASGGDAAEQLAVDIAGSVPGFVARMNRRAEELGMHSTHFVNPTGLHDVNHWMSVSDTLTLLLEAMKHPKFVEVMTTKAYQSTMSPDFPEGLIIQSTVLKDFKNQALSFRVLGGKTGFTEEAGLCLFTYAEKAGSTFFVITMKAPYQETRTQDALDHIALLNGLKPVPLEGR